MPLPRRQLDLTFGHPPIWRKVTQFQLAAASTLGQSWARNAPDPKTCCVCGTKPTRIHLWVEHAVTEDGSWPQRVFPLCTKCQGESTPTIH